MSVDSLLALLDAAAPKRALFVGESIDDVYHYVKPLGRPLKEPILSMELINSERFHGGIDATARHAASFCAAADMWSNTIVTKERWVEPSHTRKLFQVYAGSHGVPAGPCKCDGYDVVAVVDYGHGMMTDALMLDIDAVARYLAVNVQTNSGNYGFNLATKYDRADYLVVDELEARLATQNQNGPIAESIEELSSIAPKVAVTLGRDGAIGWSAQTGVVAQAPLFTDRTVDTMGAGDAFFAVTALIAAESDIESLLVIGNAAGALKAQIVGHRASVTKAELAAYLKNGGV